MKRPNKRVRSDAAPRPGIGAKIGYGTYFELKPASEKSRRGARAGRWAGFDLSTAITIFVRKDKR
jgi:hypothetical protein